MLNLIAGDIEPGGPAFYRYRGKGGKQGRRELPRPAYVACVSALSAFDRELGTMPPDASIWPTSAHTGGVSSGTVYANFRRYLQAAELPPSGLHILRHSAAKLRRDAGESIEDVSRFLDHSTLAVTTTYLRRLEGEQDAAWPRVAGSLRLAIK